MERVAFLIEKTGQRIECLLNPASVTITRQAGVRTRRSVGGAVTGLAATDDSVLATGGGVTELQMELLFDMSKVDAAKAPEDIRDLTSPLWNLAENSHGASDADATGAPLVRFVWGKSWNIPGMVTAVAERFENFTAGGTAQRSWVSLRFLRVNVDDAPAAMVASAGSAAAGILPLQLPGLEGGAAVPEDQWPAYQVAGEAGSEAQAGSAERTDQLSHRFCGSAANWRIIANANRLANPAALVVGMVLRLPPLRGLR